MTIVTLPLPLNGRVTRSFAQASPPATGRIIGPTRIDSAFVRLLVMTRFLSQVVHCHFDFMA